MYKDCIGRYIRIRRDIRIHVLLEEGFCFSGTASRFKTWAFGSGLRVAGHKDFQNSYRGWPPKIKSGAMKYSKDNSLRAFGGSVQMKPSVSVSGTI